jgi:3-deoxy-manno-octulosonate cytidylyltransferase (CMP-KDO synthetase)
MNVLGIIPARYASTRFPGKPLVDIHGKTMIEHVYEKVSKKIEHVVVATDDDRILRCVRGFGGHAVMTSGNHATGTSRCAEALALFKKNHQSMNLDVVINIQGDEPTLQPEQLEELLGCFNNKETDIATLVKKTNDIKDIVNPNVVKVVINKYNQAMYFSRSAIPYVRDEETSNWGLTKDFYRHIGIYGFKAHILPKLPDLEPAEIEKAEKLEQLSWLFHGLTIAVAQTRFDNIGIDTPEDLQALLQSNRL